MNRFKSIAALAALSLAVSACGGHGSSGPTLPANPGTTFTGSIPAALMVPNWNKDALTGATYVGPATGSHLNAMVLVHQQNSNGLLQYAREVSDPSSPNFRHFLTPQQIGERYGASQSDYQKAAQYFLSNGLAVGGWPQHMLLSVAGDQSQFERAMGTKFAVYSKNGQQFIAPTGTPHFTTKVPVDGVGRIVTYNPMHSYLVPAPPRAGAGFATGFSPSQVANAFDFTGAYGAGFDGTGITIGIIGTGPIDVGGTSGDKDLDAFAAATHARVAHVTQVAVTANGVAAGLNVSGIPTAPPATPNPNGTPAPVPGGPGFPYSNDFQTPPPVTTPTCTGNLPACNPEDGEAQLDVQQTASLATGANVKFYLAYNASDCYTFFPNSCGATPAPSASPGANAGAAEIGIVEADAEIQQAIGDNTADVLSLSYGGGETQQFANYNDYQTSFQQLQFAALTAEGIAAFASSGDYGSAECLGPNNTYLSQVCVSYPSGDDNVTSVGGVTAPLDGFGNLQGPMIAWGISTQESGYGAYSGSGGGKSTLMPAPSWQSAAVSGATMREQPDVSMIGDPNTGVATIMNARFSGALSGVGGTSVAAPQMAAMWALVLEACKANPGHGMCPPTGSGPYWRLGNASPYLYAIYKGTPVNSVTPALAYANVFFDVLYGDNEMQNPDKPNSAPIPGAKAMTGFDQVTGVGVPYAGHLITAITGQSVP